jgi:hypothetical protein
LPARFLPLPCSPFEESRWLTRSCGGKPFEEALWDDKPDNCKWPACIVFVSTASLTWRPAERLSY